LASELRIALRRLSRTEKAKDLAQRGLRVRRVGSGWLIKASRLGERRHVASLANVVSGRSADRHRRRPEPHGHARHLRVEAPICRLNTTREDSSDSTSVL